MDIIEKFHILRIPFFLSGVVITEVESDLSHSEILKTSNVPLLERFNYDSHYRGYVLPIKGFVLVSLYRGDFVFDADRDRINHVKAHFQEHYPDISLVFVDGFLTKDHLSALIDG
jgi:hypothetical protein